MKTSKNNKIASRKINLQPILLLTLLEYSMDRGEKTYNSILDLSFQIFSLSIKYLIK